MSYDVRMFPTQHSLEAAVMIIVMCYVCHTVDDNV